MTGLLATGLLTSPHTNLHRPLLIIGFPIGDSLWKRELNSLILERSEDLQVHLLGKRVVRSTSRPTIGLPGFESHHL